MSASSLQKRVFQVMEIGQTEDRESRLFDVAMLSLILLNIVAMVWETTYTEENLPSAFVIFELVSIVIFTFEYVLRLWACVASPRFEGSIRGRVKYIFSPMALVDLLAVAPFWLALGADTRTIRALRLMRLFRIAKIGRYASTVRILRDVVRDKREDLIVSATLLLILLLASSTLMYTVEHEVNDSIDSIPAAMWWGVATLTTVGYGDVTPETGVGRLLGSVIAILGIGMFALPTSILGAGFVEQLSRERESQKIQRCPHCGESLDS